MPYQSVNRRRPILKHFGTSSDDSDSPYSSAAGMPIFNTNRNKVHFPNHPDALARMHFAHSPDAYDRSPIAVGPNVCALPERGCPGRTYLDGGTEHDMNADVGIRCSESTSTRVLKKSDHLHPRARVTGFDAGGSSSDSSCSPCLIPDLLDTSEDSDNGPFAPSFDGSFASSSMSNNWQYFSASSSSLSASSSHSSPRLSPKADLAQLAFLPHPHSSSHTPERSTSAYPYSSGSSMRDSRSSHCSPSSPTHQRHRSRSRVRGSPVRERHGSGGPSAAHRGTEDEGCLGGF